MGQIFPAANETNRFLAPSFLERVNARFNYYARQMGSYPPAWRDVESIVINEWWKMDCKARGQLPFVNITQLKQLEASNS